MIVSCNVQECKHNDGNEFCNHEKELLIINYSDDGEKMPVCVDFEEDKYSEAFKNIAEALKYMSEAISETVDNIQINEADYVLDKFIEKILCEEAKERGGGV